MSLNQLLSFLPFARQPGSDADARASSAAFMVFLSMNLLAAVWGFMLLLSVIGLLVFAVLTSEVAFFGTPDARDAEIQSINSINDIGVLQHKAAFDVSQGYENGATATSLCHFALITLFFMMIASIAGLLLVRWIKKHLGTVGDDEVPGPSRAAIDLLNRLKRTESETEG